MAVERPYSETRVITCVLVACATLISPHAFSTFLLDATRRSPLTYVIIRAQAKGPGQRFRVLPPVIGEKYWHRARSNKSDGRDPACWVLRRILRTRDRLFFFLEVGI